MKIETDTNGKVTFLLPTKEEFDAWVADAGFTPLSDFLDGYAILSKALNRVNKELEDPEHEVADEIISAQDCIETDIFNLFACAFNDFIEKKGGAK